MAFVLLVGEVDVLPAGGVGADVFEFVRLAGEEGDAVGGHGVEDAQVDEVAQVGPDADEHDEVRGCEDGVEVVEDFGGL